MTQQQGLYTVQTWIALDAGQRARLEWLVRSQGGDLAETLTRIVADRSLADLPASDEVHAGERLPVRLFLTPEQREAFERQVELVKAPLPELLTQIVADHLESVPEPPADPRAAAQAPAAPDMRRRRGELARLRARRDAAGGTAPAWLHAYIAELEAELQ